MTNNQFKSFCEAIIFKFFEIPIAEPKSTLIA